MNRIVNSVVSLAEDDPLKRIKNKVLNNLDMTSKVDDEKVGRIIDEIILHDEKSEEISLREKVKIRNEIFNSIRKYDCITEYMAMPVVTEIMVNGRDKIFLEKGGHLTRADKSFETVEKLVSVTQQIVAGCNRRVNELNPIVDARLPDGSRVNIVMPPVALDGPVITIRKFPQEVYSMEQLCSFGALDTSVAEMMKLLVKARYNIFISGGTGSGKTTFLNALSDFIPKDERVITIEDSAELKITGIENLVRLEARNANVAGDGEITIRDLIKASLRMRPDRIIVGEVRDAAAIDMLQAMGTGHDGSISTGHANSTRDMLTRLETMIIMGGIEIPMQAIRNQIASSLDIIIHLGRLRDKSRKVLAIDEVVGMKNGEIELNRLYEFVELDSDSKKVKGKLRRVNELVHTEKLMAQGIFGLYRENVGGTQLA